MCMQSCCIPISSASEIADVLVVAFTAAPTFRFRARPFTGDATGHGPFAAPAFQAALMAVFPCAPVPDDFPADQPPPRVPQVTLCQLALACERVSVTFCAQCRCLTSALPCWQRVHFPPYCQAPT